MTLNPYSEEDSDDEDFENKLERYLQIINYLSHVADPNYWDELVASGYPYTELHI